MRDRSDSRQHAASMHAAVHAMWPNKIEVDQYESVVYEERGY